MEQKKWYYSMPAKTGIFIALILSTMLTLGGVLGCIYFWENGFYTNTKSALVWDTFYDMAWQESYRISNLWTNGELTGKELFLQDTNLSYEVLDEDGKKLSGNYSGKETGYEYEFWQDIYYYAEPVFQPEEEMEQDVFLLKLYVDEDLPYSDKYSFVESALSLAYGLRYWVYPIVIVSLLAAAVCFVCLMCGAGRRNEYEGIRESMMARIPFDVYTCAVGIAAFYFTWFMCEAFIWYGNGAAMAIIAGAVLMFVLLIAGVGFCMNLAVRIKLGTVWSNTLICRAWHIIARMGRMAWRGCGMLFSMIPMAWRTLVIAFIVFVLKLFSILIWSYDPEVLLLLVLLETIIVVPLLMYLVYCLRTLQKGGKALAEGNLNYQVKSKGLVWEFKDHANDLNSIRDGMNAAVNERMKSERMKTELITNVSHDIKTPLTSIINYTDLIVKEQSENEKINEYAQVLARQSARLKKLIEDLVEASKASTGNLDVTLSPMEVGVMVTQAAGEYTERLALRNLTLITKQPEEPLKIMADGRHLWRVMDNLMNNVCKYAQPGTRVYLSVEKKLNRAVITLKNTSEYALDTEADELMERFVRGDASRSTEGNGLGLSIAQSLTELQGGKMQLTVDGDLFKVMLSFPALSE